MISLKPWSWLFDAWNNNNYSLPNAGSEKMLIVVVSSGIDSEINKKTSEKKTNPRHWKSLKIIEPFWTFGVFSTFSWNKQNTAKKSGIFLFKFSTTPENCKLLWKGKHLAWAFRGDMEKYCIQTQCLPNWTPRTYGEMKVLHTKIWVK